MTHHSSRELLPDDARPVCLMDAKHGDCRFVIGVPQGGLTIFCGAPVKAGKSYCKFHCGIVYEKQQKPRRRK